jgi:pimeloyl-ACP methyl ester carboxylesterase
VPHLRGHGTTRFLESRTPRSGQQAAIGADVIALMDALKLPRALVAGYDWGGRAACVAAALWPERCTGLVSVNSYLIQDIAKAAIPIAAKEWKRRGYTAFTFNHRKGPHHESEAVPVRLDTRDRKWAFHQGFGSGGKWNATNDIRSGSATN